MLITAKSIQW